MKRFMRYYKFIFLGLVFMILVGCNGSATAVIDGNSSDPLIQKISKEDIDNKVDNRFGSDTTKESNKLSSDEKMMSGNWYGENKKEYRTIWLQLRKDGTYKFISKTMLGKFHNIPREAQYSGKWHLQNSNSQLILDIPDIDAPLICSNRFPKIEMPQNVTLYPGIDIDDSFPMQIDSSKDVVTSNGPTPNVKKIMKRKVDGSRAPNYFTFVAPKANNEKFWGDLTPPGYNYGHKIYKPFSSSSVNDWKYALKRVNDDSKNYLIVISDESWQTYIGHRKSYTKDIQDPKKLYKWFEYWKRQMMTLGEVNGTVYYILGGDAPSYWAGNIVHVYHGDPKKVPAKVVESRFPEALELNPSQSFAGVFQVMDYLRMKYAPNLKLGYTLKTWGVVGLSDTEPSEGWDNSKSTQTMANYINNFGVQFDLLAFNLNPRAADRTEDGYKSVLKYYGAISKKLHTRDGSKAKLWIWKLSLWNKSQRAFYFQHIDFLVKEANTIGLTLGHGNDLEGKSGFEEPIKSWLKEYYQGVEIGNGSHATKGPVYWR